jgi:hypothetical protein
MLQPWYDAVSETPAAQERVLDRLLADYARTEDGRQHGASHIDDIGDYRRAYPQRDYLAFKPLLERVMSGDTGVLLAEEPLGWAITRGTSSGESKFIPMTPTDIRQRVSAGRAILNYVYLNSRYDLFDGVNLNLNFPSSVGQIETNGNIIEYGYSSGIYSKHVAAFTPIKSVPSQEQIDELGGGKKLSDWAKRFEKALELCRSEQVTLVGGVCQTAIEFARYLRRKHKCYPKDLWRPLLMALGSTPGINTRYRPALQALYGRTIIREIYGATEGIFGQQRDQKRAWVPNYDLFFFEVETRSGIKMLHEMRYGEWGNLIVSTPTLPRYRIGDVILAFGSSYFRCIGRDEWWTVWKYAWDELATVNLNRL